MARIKARAQAIRRRRSENDLPDEPSLEGVVTNPSDTRLILALNYYAHLDLKDKEDVLRRWLVEWAGTCPAFTPEEIKILEKVEKWRITSGIAGLSRQLSRGLSLAPDLVMKHIDRIKDVVRRWTDVQEPKKEKPVGGRVGGEVMSSVLADMEDLYDQFVLSDYKTQFSAYQYLTEKQVSQVVARGVAEKYRRVLEDYHLLKKGDRDMKEAYSYLKKPQINSIVEQLTSIVQDSERYYGNLRAAVVRKPRKRKEKSAADQVKGMTYLKAFPELKLVSVDPSQIPGSTSVWLYSTKYKTLRHLSGKLTVKGSTVHGWDPKLSEARTLRKPEQTLSQILNGTSITVKKVLSGLTTKPQAVNGRVNSDTIIVRAFR